MLGSEPEDASLRRWKCLPLAVSVGLAVVVFGIAICFTSHFLREKTRHLITRQYGQMLYAHFLRQNIDKSLDLTEIASGQTQLRLGQMADCIKVFGSRLFNGNGNFIYSDPGLSEFTLPAEDMANLRKLIPVARLLESGVLDQSSAAALESSPHSGPLLEVLVPLHAPSGRELLGVMQSFLDGTEVAADFKILDQNLKFQALSTFLIGGGLMVLVSGMRFKRLQRVER